VVDRTRLETVPCLAALPEPARDAIAGAFDEVEVPAGERVTSQGDFAYEIFAIVEGTARVEQDGTVVSKLGPGEMFGEIGLLLTGRRTAAIVAETPMQLLAMFDQSYRRLSKAHPEFEKVVRDRCGSRFTRPATV
jgi:CRP/FNR family transcriptional regulator, cyclic AMP receptor protein